MKIEVFLHYEGEKLNKKDSFVPGEKGSFGWFVQSPIGRRDQPENYAVFAPNQKDFDHEGSEGVVGNHRFQSFLFKELKLDSEKGIMTGGKDGEYEFNNGILSIRPYFKYSGKPRGIIGY